MKHKLTDFCFCFRLHQFIELAVLFCCFSKQNGFPIILSIWFIEPSTATSSKRLRQVRCLRFRGIYRCYFPAEGPYGETLYRGFDKLAEAIDHGWLSKQRQSFFLLRDDHARWMITRLFLSNPIVVENSKSGNKQAKNVRLVIEAQTVIWEVRNTGPLTNQSERRI